MTGSDLCASSKPWDLQMQTVTTIYEEFYMQGDSEMMAGRTPLPIMDRSFEDQQALHQVVCWFHFRYRFHGASYVRNHTLLAERCCTQPTYLYLATASPCTISSNAEKKSFLAGQCTVCLKG